MYLDRLFRALLFLTVSEAYNSRGNWGYVRNIMRYHDNGWFHQNQCTRNRTRKMYESGLFRFHDSVTLLSSGGRLISMGLCNQTEVHLPRELLHVVATAGEQNSVRPREHDKCSVFSKFIAKAASYADCFDFNVRTHRISEPWYLSNLNPKE